MKSILKVLSVAVLIGAANHAVAQESKEKVVYNPRKKQSLLSRATVLYDRGQCIMVPKGSILVLPESLKRKIAEGGPKGKLVKWRDFFNLNSTWLHRHEVTTEQARGDKQIDQEVFESLKRLNKIVIAVNGDALTSVSAKAITYETEE